jgi:2'-5' RNA ligase
VSEPIRAFLAIELSDEARRVLAAAASELGSVAPRDARFVPIENLHLTLKFLGHLPEEAFPRLLHGLVPRLVKAEPFEVELCGFGAFPSARSARVLWVGVTDGARSLARLARRLDAAAARVGVERERRPFRAHLTVARLRQPAAVPIERVEAPAPVRFPAEEVVLFQSHLSNSGARYSPMARLPLGKRAAEADIERLSIHPEG